MNVSKQGCGPDSTLHPVEPVVPLIGGTPIMASKRPTSLERPLSWKATTIPMTTPVARALTLSKPYARLTEETEVPRGQCCRLGWSISNPQLASTNRQTDALIDHRMTCLISGQRASVNDVVAAEAVPRLPRGVARWNRYGPGERISVQPYRVEQPMLAELYGPARCHVK